MRRFSILIGVAAVVIGAAAFGYTSDGRAQQGAPGVAGTGVTTELLGRFPSELAPGQALALLRITFAPGGSVAEHTHPGETIFHLASGTLQFTLHEGQARLVRAVDGSPAAATPTAMETIPVGEEITLATGDTVYYDAAVVQSERNDGDVDAVVLASNLRGADEPARVFHEDMGSPAAGTPAA